MGLPYTSVSQPTIEGQQSKDPKQESGLEAKAETMQKHYFLMCCPGLFRYLSYMPQSYLPKPGIAHRGLIPLYSN